MTTYLFFYQQASEWSKSPEVSDNAVFNMMDFLMGIQLKVMAHIGSANFHHWFGRVVLIDGGD